MYENRPVSSDVRPVSLFVRMMKYFVGTTFICAMCFSLGGCDQARDQAVALLQGNSPAKSLDSASKAYAEGDYRKAIEFAQSYVNQKSEHQYSLALLTARSYGKLGEAGRTVEYLQIADSISQINRLTLMTDPAFEEVVATIEFVKFIASNSEVRSTQTYNAPRRDIKSDVSATAGTDVSTQIGSKSTSATAGGVSVKISQ